MKKQREGIHHLKINQDNLCIPTQERGNERDATIAEAGAAFHLGSVAFQETVPRPHIMSATDLIADQQPLPRLKHG
jgi:hypothetical protein